jgi:cyanate permease
MTIASIEPGRFYGWKALAVAAVMYFAMTGLLLYSFPAILPFLCDSFGWSRASVSWANSLAIAVTGLVSPLAGMYVMRHEARKAVAVGGILCVLCFVCASFHARLWQLYLAYAVLFGLGGSLCGMLTMTTIIGSIGSPFAGWIRDVSSSYTSAWELAILILAIGLVSLILARPPVHPSIREHRAASIVGVHSSSSMNSQHSNLQADQSLATI